MLHETVVSVFIRDRKLLIERRRRDRDVYAGFFMCPSGHIKGGESPREALRREMREELDIKVTGARHLFTIDDTDPRSGLRFRHNFMLIESFDGVIRGSREADRLFWKSYGELEKEGLAPIVRELVERLHRAGML